LSGSINGLQSPKSSFNQGFSGRRIYELSSDYFNVIGYLLLLFRWKITGSVIQDIGNDFIQL
jgi:hypothetical protein